MNEISPQKTYTQMRADFYKLYNEAIVPALEEYEKPRKTIVLIVIILYALMFILGFYLSYRFFLGYRGVHFIKDSNTFFSQVINYLIFLVTPICGSREVVFPLTTYLVLLIPFSVAQYYKSKYEKEIKKIFMRKILPIMGKLKWNCRNKIDMDEASGLKIFPDFWRVIPDDYFKGDHNGVTFEIFDLSLEDKRTDRKGGTYYVSVFEGVIIKFKLNKSFAGHTIITNDSLLHWSPSSDLRHTVLEDVQFEKKYDVFTTDEVEARYLITTAFIDRLNNLKTKFLAKNINCVFKDGYLYVVFKKKDAFGICNIYKSFADFEQFYSMFEQILAIRYLIDTFKLDQKIGM